MGGFSIETVRPGAQFAPDAAASFRRLEHDWGRVQLNSTYRDWYLQLRMYDDWRAYVEGVGPKPNHSRAIHPKYSKHCLGLAFDSDDWRTPGFIETAAEHGWIRTAASDPTERHHFEYQSWRDQRINDPAPEPEPEPEPSTLEDTEMILLESLPDRGRALVGPGYFRPLRNSEELREAAKLATTTMRGNARQFDVWKAIVLQGTTPKQAVTLTPAQLDQITEAARAGGADAIAGLEFVVKVTG